ncbi:MOSC domain-containing protein [Deinococcus maricopensis]|uniref:MOSC domain containing protein n=1 Tax=Deinococcus maricopensis (strain DSM 21211 / LMG 22137 / NRRL B-23946 / LB-34) TaxID=709986 RepID=E8U4I3_DEIML|nr:MOSC domain-containing protein [Deinococcus maricopensis]ADV68848.1 MOSC domain containing protein [Deinococcus maricopensis DSM 21211]
MTGTVTAVSRSEAHGFSKHAEPGIRLLAGLGVEGDVHAGVTVKHRSRVAVDPAQPNLRQVHLMHAELHDELRAAGFDVRAGSLGENVTTRGVDLLGLPVGARLQLGASAVVEVTGLRNPCAQIEAFQPGLLARVAYRAADGTLVRRAGVMGVVLVGGTVRAGDVVTVTLPPPHRPLERV